jgi:hypothetical protein
MAQAKRFTIQKERIKLSHLVEIKCEIRDLDALSLACRDLHKQLVRAPMGQKVQGRTYGGTMVDCDAYVKLDGPYDVILTREPKGTYKMQTDFWAGSVAKEIGENGKRLVQMYGVNKAEMSARRLGHAVTRQITKTGAINVLISGGRF